MQNKQKKFGVWLDRIGTTASWICAVHCLVLPLFVVSLPVIGLGFLLEEATERIFILFSSVIAALSLIPAYFWEHRKIQPIFLASSGISLIVLTHLLFEDNWLLKFIFLVFGALLLTTAHLLNRRFCRDCVVCQH